MSDNKNLQDDLNEMIGDTKEEFKKAKKIISEKAEIFTDDAKELADKAKEKANEFSGEAKEAYEKLTGKNKKVLAGVTAILLGGFGVHKFVLGYTKEGLILLGATLALNIFGFLGMGSILGAAVWVFTFIEGIIYLTKSNADFVNTYQKAKKAWF